VVGGVAGIDHGGDDGRMSKDLADAKEGDVTLDGEGGMKKAKQSLAFFTVDRDPAAKRRDRHKDFSVLSRYAKSPILIRIRHI
jgi:hypothetical protein